MQPRSHRALLRRAVSNTGDAWLHARLPELLRGSDDEDVHRWFGLRLPAFGLTHTYVPGSWRGELCFPSAKTLFLHFSQRAMAAKDDAQAAWYLGRIAHLYCDVVVPARAQRVWHFDLDPLEGYIDAHIEELVASCDGMSEPAAPIALLSDLALFARTLKADTTRTPWGRAAYRWFGRGAVVTESEARVQALALVPLVICRLARALYELRPRER
jgi:hypothetical protein